MPSGWNLKFEYLFVNLGTIGGNAFDTDFRLAFSFREIP